MAIVFGTDFSEQATVAAYAAAALAHRGGEALHLAHVLDFGSAGRSSATEETLRREATSRLEQQAVELRRREVPVTTHLLDGAPDEVLIELAAQVHAPLLVLSHHGQRAPRWRIGSVVERVVQSARCPVLVLRSPHPIEAWARGERSLRVLLGLNFSTPSDAAVAWVRRMRALGPCEVIAAHHYWGADAHARYGVPLHSGAEVAPEAEQALRRDLTARLGDMPGSGAVWVHLEPGLGRPSEALVHLARKEAVDLVVVGTHQRAGASRWWHGSVSQRVLHEAPTSVLCVPTSAASTRAIPHTRRVLAPTDLSEEGSEAVRYAYALAPAGGTVHLLHVLPLPAGAPPMGTGYALPEPSTAQERSDRDQLTAELRALIPPEATARGITTRVELVTGRKVSEAICQAAERLDCDVICLATHGRSGLARTLAGSVAQEVLLRGSRPVFIVRPSPNE
ncbi:universal stress protein [Hyalangium rubrum]|uniref:Universal stress protein n=1 Tax=Hyalangium rubrum TaxID=3103134 RepID=A0ABU5H425_9BACT|nr:universal stress protein [Hyalangium sp. s54d21]MDY7228227.1 universal stress protein [Hyalangium sp. s54d21]